MLEELKFALLSLPDSNEIGSYFGHFWESNTWIKVVYKSITVEGYEDRILVFYEYNIPRTIGWEKLNYLNRQNTLRTFTNVPSSIAYLLYLSKAVSDIKFELYYYFLFKIKELGLEYECMSFANTGLERQFLRCDFGGLKLNGISVKFNFVIVFSHEGNSELVFYSENPVWNEGKFCPENQIDQILDYFVRYSGYQYDDIPLQEV